MDKVYWCGQEDPPGINYNECIDITECEFVAEYSFWRMASQVVRQWYKCVPCTIRNNKILKKKVRAGLGPINFGHRNWKSMFVRAARKVTQPY